MGCAQKHNSATLAQTFCTGVCLVEVDNVVRIAMVYPVTVLGQQAAVNSDTHLSGAVLIWKACLVCFEQCYTFTATVSRLKTIQCT